MRTPIDTPENREILINHFGKKPIRELEMMVGYKENAIRDFAKSLGLKGRYKSSRKGLSKTEAYRLSANYDPQTYVDAYITDNVVYDDNVYAYRNGYVLGKEDLTRPSLSNPEFALSGKRPVAANYFI